MRGLNGKVAVIAGAAPGNIGAATAHRLAQEGALVVAADLNESAALAVAEEIVSAGGTAVGHAVDVANEAAFAELIAFASSTYGGVDSLFNVAADLSLNNLGRDTDVLTIPNEVWQHTFDVTLTGYMFGIRYAIPEMMKRGGGSIVNTMSAAVWRGEAIRLAYASAKAGIAGLTRHAATIGGKHGIRCNAVAPGLVLTAAAMKTTSEELYTELLNGVRSTRLGEPDDIAAAVAFLFSDDAKWINGQTLVVDGGVNLVT
jgi:NAD(P)-dependent dehydrogenase (short-subunit alcohol dehydrogenase family)